MSELTPGDWVIHWDAGVIHAPTATDPWGEIICSFDNINDYQHLAFSNTGRKANAKCMAASKKMLEALNDADEAINPPDKSGISMMVWGQRLRAATETIRSAIAAAEPPK